MAYPLNHDLKHSISLQTTETFQTRCSANELPIQCFVVGSVCLHPKDRPPLITMSLVGLLYPSLPCVSESREHLNLNTCKTQIVNRGFWLSICHASHNLQSKISKTAHRYWKMPRTANRQPKEFTQKAALFHRRCMGPFWVPKDARVV